MEKPKQKRRSLSARIGAGGFSFLILLSGLVLHFNTLWRYRLVLRDEPRLLGAPAPFIYVGAGLSLTALFLIWLVVRAQGRRIGWGLREGRSRGGPIQWEDIIACVVAGGLLGTSSLGLWINCHFDKSPEQSHVAAVTQMYHCSNKRNRGNYMYLTDWKTVTDTVILEVHGDTFHNHRVGDQVTIKTKPGFLGYEWITSFE